MDNAASREQIDAAKAYEALHVPSLFGPWAPRVLDAIPVGPGQRFLDVACGTGVLAREALGRVGASGRVAGVDPDPGMLAVAEQLAPGVEWHAGTADSIPFPDATFDAVGCQFGFMFFPDRARALIETQRVLAPGGRVAVAVWDSLERNAAYAELVDLLQRRAGPPAAAALRAPFALGDRDALEVLFRDSGLDAVESSTVTGTARFPGLRTMVEADLRGWLPVMGVELEEPLIQRILDEAGRILSSYVTSTGEVVFDTPAHIITGRRAQE